MLFQSSGLKAHLSRCLTSFHHNILPITFLMLKPKVIIVSLPNGGLL